MEDGILLLLVCYIKSQISEIDRLRSQNIDFIYRHPDCGGDIALEWAEGEMVKDELLANLPEFAGRLAVDADYDVTEVDAVDELPF